MPFTSKCESQTLRKCLSVGDGESFVNGGNVKKHLKLQIYELLRININDKHSKAAKYCTGCLSKVEAQYFAAGHSAPTDVSYFPGDTDSGNIADLSRLVSDFKHAGLSYDATDFHSASNIIPIVNDAIEHVQHHNDTTSDQLKHKHASPTVSSPFHTVNDSVCLPVFKLAQSTSSQSSFTWVSECWVPNQQRDYRLYW